MEPVVENEGTYRVQPERRIGCRVCASTCPTDSITLVRKLDSQQEAPPKNIVDWSMKRAENRRIKITMD